MVCSHRIDSSKLTKKQSLVIVKNLVIFSNSIGDLTAVDFNNGEINMANTNSGLEGFNNITLKKF